MQKFPLSTPEHVLLVQIQESLADLNYYQLETVKALKCYNKALNTLENIAISEKDILYKQLMEAKGESTGEHFLSGAFFLLSVTPANLKHYNHGY